MEFETFLTCSQGLMLGRMYNNIQPILATEREIHILSSILILSLHVRLVVSCKLLLLLRLYE